MSNKEGLVKYNIYKNSNLIWIKDIPDNWEVIRLKDLGKVVLGKMLNTTAQENYELKPYLKSKNIGWLNVNIDSVEEMYFSKNEMKNYRVKKDDLLLSEGGEVGKTCIWNNEVEECYIQNSVHKITFNKHNNPRYYLYLSFILGHSKFYDSVVNQVSIKHLTWEKLINISFTVPPLIEQTQIANYLDTKTQAIDKKINLLTTKIEYYKELRKTIINNAVTKGLDNNVKLKESELGLKPSHWAISRLKEIDIVIMGQSPKSDDYNFEKKGYPFLQGNAEFGNLYPTPSTWCEVAVKVINVNDIMLSVRAPIGAVNIANQKYGIGRGLCAIRAKKSFYKFLYYYFISQNHILQSLGTGTTYIAISLNDVANILVAFPPKQEQTEIATYLDAKTNTIDKITTNLQTQIETLKELRKTLINDVVTGKVKVIA